MGAELRWSDLLARGILVAGMAGACSAPGASGMIGDAGASSATLSGDALAETLQEARAAIQLLRELSSIPSVSDNPAGVRRAAGWLESQFRELGFEVRSLDAGPRANPLLFAHRPIVKGAPSATILFYMHYDTQPTGPAEDWISTGGEPFVPRLLSGRWDEPGVKSLQAADLDAPSLMSARLYARGAADDKAPIVMHLRALRRWLAMPAAGRLHLKFLLDGEEEAGSPHIAQLLDRHEELLRADLLVLCDGPMDALGRPSVYLGTRGDMHMKLSLRTAAQPGHSGNYGLLPNAAWRLAALLSTMKDREGHVAIQGFMDDVVPPTQQERTVLQEASEAEPIIARQLGAARFEGDSRIPYYERLLFRPGLILNQLGSGRPGNQIPVVAEALLEVRLVTRQDPRKVYEAVRRHVKEHEPEAELEYLGGSPAGRMDPADPEVARGIAAVKRAAGSEILIYPSLGGTLPLLQSFAESGHHYIGLPLVNFDNNQHVGNENLKVSVLPAGIELLVRLYEALAGP